MATVVPSAWTVKSIKGHLHASCTVTTDASQEVAFTKKTPKELDTSKPYTLFIKTSDATDGAAAPVALHVGYGETFALAGTTARCTDTAGCIYGNVTNDTGYAAAGEVAIWMNPNLLVAPVVTIAAVATGLKFLSPVAPYHAFEIYAADAETLLTFTATFTIIQ
jgi:hypothetical protein